MEDVDVSVLFDRKRAVHWRSLAPVIKVITEGLIDSAPSDVWYNLEILEEGSDFMRSEAFWLSYLLKQTSNERNISVYGPREGDVWSEDYLHFLLLMMSHVEWSCARDAAWPEVLEGYASIALAAERWSLDRVFEKDRALYYRFDAICNGLSFIGGIQSKVFVLLAMRNLMHRLGDKLKDGGDTFLIEAVQWMLAAEATESRESSHLLVWLDSHDDEASLRRLGDLCRHAPNEAIRELRAAHRAKRGMKLIDRLPEYIRVVAGVGVGVKADYNPRHMREWYQAEIKGFSTLSRKPEWRAQVLKDVLRVGSE